MLLQNNQERQIDEIATTLVKILEMLKASHKVNNEYYVAVKYNEQQ